MEKKLNPAIHSNEIRKLKKKIEKLSNDVIKNSNDIKKNSNAIKSVDVTLLYNDDN